MGANKQGGRNGAAKPGTAPVRAQPPRPEETSPLETCARLNATLDALPDLLFVLDRDGRIVDYHAPNPERLYVPPDRFLGRTMNDMLPEPAVGIVNRAIADALAHGHHRGSRYPLPAPDGERWYEISIAAQGDPQAAAGRLVAIVRDVTDRQRAEDALRESEQTYRMLTEGMQDVIWILDVEARRFTYVSPSVEKLRGYTPAEILARPLEDAWVPAEREKLDHFVRQSVAAFLAGQITSDTYVTYEMLQPCKDGAVVASEVVARLVRNERTGRLEAHGVTRNISRRAQAENSLRESETRFNNVAQTSRSYAWEVDADGLLTYVSPVVEDVLGYRPDEIVGCRHFYDFYPAEDAEKAKEASLRIFRMARPVAGFENPNQTKDGRVVWVSSSATPLFHADGSLRGYQGVDIDVTARKQVEDALRESESRFAQLARQSRTIVFEMDAEGCCTFVSPEVADVLGYRPEDVVGKLYFYDLFSPGDREAFKAAAFEVFRKNAPLLDFENPCVTRDGRNLWVTTNALPLLDPDGTLRGYRGSVRDVTDRKRAEDGLRESEARFAQTARQSRAFVWEVDVRGRYMFISPVVEDVLGYRPDEIAGRLHFYDLHPAEGRKAFKAAAIDVVRRHGEFRDYENPMVAKDGRTMWVSTNAIPLLDEHGALLGYRGVDFDVTERKLAEEALKRSEAKYRQLHESMRDPFATTDLKGNFLDCNPAFEDLLGYSRDELLRLNFRDVTPRKWHAQEKKIIAGQVRKRGFSSVYEKEYVRKDGAVVPVELRTLLACDAGGKPTGLSAFIRDISERRRSEQALRESEAKYRRLLEWMRDAFVFADLDGRLVECNSAFEALVGYRRDEIARLRYADITPAKWRAVDARAVKQVLRHGNSGVTEKEYVRKDGTIVPVEMSGTLIRDMAGKPVGISAIVRDVSERKRTEQALREAHDELERRVQERTAELVASRQALAQSEEQFRQMAESIQEVFWLVDAQTGRALYISPAFESIWGRARETLENGFASWLATLHPDDREGVQRDFARGVRTGLFTPMEYRILWPDGTVRWIRDSAWGIRDRRGRVVRVAGVFRDITEQRRLESEILQAAEAERQRIGRDLHDELGQSLTAIGYLADAIREDLARAKRPEAAEIRKLGRLIGQTAAQSHALARGLLLADLQRGGLAAALQELASRTQELFGVACRYAGSASVPPLDAQAAGQLYRIAQEAAANAAKHGKSKRIEIRLAKNRRGLLLTVRDTGRGLPARIHDGRGLGLDIMRYRAGLIGATLWIDSQPRRGTTVKCLLPLAAPASPRKK